MDNHRPMRLLNKAFSCNLTAILRMTLGELHDSKRHLVEQIHSLTFIMASSLFRMGSYWRN